MARGLLPATELDLHLPGSMIVPAMLLIMLVAKYRHGLAAAVFIGAYVAIYVLARLVEAAEAPSPAAKSTS